MTSSIPTPPSGSPGNVGGAGAPAGEPDGLTSVFVVDDHEVVRVGLSELIATQHDLRLAGSAGTAAEAVSRITATRPDVAVLDARLPDGSGIEVCREIRSTLPDTRVIMLTSYDDDDAVFAAVMAGAAGYLLKEVRGSALNDANRQVAAGRSLLDPAVTERVMRRLRDGKDEDERLRALTERERELLGHIASGMSNREIGQVMFLSEKTIKNYVSRLLAKLGMQRRSQAAVYGSQILPPADQ